MRKSKDINEALRKHFLCGPRTKRADKSFLSMIHMHTLCEYGYAYMYICTYIVALYPVPGHN